MDSSLQGTIIAVFSIPFDAGRRFLSCKPGVPAEGRRSLRTHLDPLTMNPAETSPTGQAVVKELVVQNKLGIHARPAAMIVRITNKFKSEVFVEKDEEQVNGKSIMGLMMLAAGRGSKVKFIASGEDAPQMLAELEALFTRKFDEA